MNLIQNEVFDAERALYGTDGARIVDCRFDGPADGESAMKECRNLEVENCFFNLRYPFWHVDHAVIKNSEMTELCRAALWYDDDITIDGCTMNGIKALRECKNIQLLNSSVVSPEYLWRCHNVKVKDTALTSEYPFFECSDLDIEGLSMKGKYSFQYVENAVIRNSNLDTKDAFWHARNITVIDSVVKGEYLGWYAEGLTFIRCRIIGEQPLCYCKNLVLEDCTMEATNLAFERSEVKATVKGSIDSVKNPASGSIQADEIGNLIMEPAYTHPELVSIQCPNILKFSEKE